MAGSNITEVNSEMLKDSARNIETDIEELTTIYLTFTGEAIGQLSSCWQGLAKDEFYKKWNVYTDVFKKYIESLEALNNQLKAAAKNYDCADESVEKIISSFK